MAGGVDPATNTGGIERVRSEGLREQLPQLEPQRRSPGTGGVDDEVGCELVENLAAGATGVTWPIVMRPNDRYRSETSSAIRYGPEDRRALGADRQAERGVLDVRTDVDIPMFVEKRGSDRKAAVGRVRTIARTTRPGQQLAGDPVGGRRV